MNQNENSYLGNPNVKRDGVVEEFTHEQIQEYIRCTKDPAYFVTKYMKVINLDKGLVPFDLYPYQQKMFEHFNENRFSIVLACRQSGKSISSCGYLLWYALFHSDKTIAILANKGATAREMLSRITLALENIPFFLQPGCRALNKGSIEFSNRSKIICAATSGSSIRGLSVNLLFLDEFAFVENANEFYTSTYPVVSSGKTSRVIVTSTANGIGNQFHKIWTGAVQGVNEFKPFRVDWWDVPGRDENWKKQTIANTSELQFKQEFGNEFFGAGDTLISGETLLGMKAKEPIHISNDVKYYQEPIAGHDYVMAVDVAKGRGQDYSTFSVIDITSRPFKQVAVYRNNLISPILFPNIIHKVAKSYNDAYVLIESNDQGAVVCNGMFYDFEYENLHLSYNGRRTDLGVEMNRKVKRIGCSNIKDLLEENRLEIVDEDTIIECSTFEAKGVSFEATDGNHDDLVMNLVLFAYFVGTGWFENESDIDIKKFLFEERMKEVEEDVLPFGYMDDGTDFAEQGETVNINGETWNVVPYNENY